MKKTIMKYGNDYYNEYKIFQENYGFGWDYHYYV